MTTFSRKVCLIVCCSLAVQAVLVGVRATTPSASASVHDHAAVVAERPVDRTVGAVDGEVRTIAQVGDTVVIGGTFTRVGPGIRGAVAPLDVASGAFAAGFPDVAGAVYAAVADGAGGWYLGGSFTSVAGVARANVAHVDAAGAVTPFVADTNAPVHAIAADAGGVYLGGAFTAVNGVASTRAVKVDRSSGAIVWNAAALNGTVRAMLVNGDRLYVGGEFLTVAGNQKRRLAALDAATGAFVPSFASGDVNGTVRDLALAGGALWVGGDFISVGGVTRQRIANLDPASGALGSFNVAVNGAVYDLELDAAASTVYLAGRFATVAGATRRSIAGVTVATGAATSLAVTSIASGDVNALSLDEAAGQLYVAGSFVMNPEKTAPSVIAKIALATGTVTRAVDPMANPVSLARTPAGASSAVWRLVRAGGTLAVAGDFSDYGIVERRHLAAFDVNTKALDLDFDPAPDGYVYTVKGSPDAASVYVGGEFATIGGAPRAGLAKLDTATGAVAPGFVANTNSYVKDLAVAPDGSTVYVGGNFLTVNGTPRARLAAVDAATGAVDPDFQIDLTEPTNDQSEGGTRAIAMTADGSRLMVIGNFRYAAGSERPLMAQIDLTTSPATVTPWATEVYDQPCARNKIGWMRDVDIAPDGQTAYVVSSGHFYYPACDTVNAFSMVPSGSDMAPLWSKKIGDTLEAVAATSDAVYIGGHFRYLEMETTSEARFQVGALDPATGDGLNWAPNADGFRGVLTLEHEPAGLFLGSDGDTVGGVPHGRFGWWAPAAAGLWVRKSPDVTVANAAGDTVQYEIAITNTQPAGDIQLTTVTDTRLGDLAAACGVPRTLAAGATLVCTAGESVSGANLETISGTVTVTGQSAGATVSDTDTSSVGLRTTLPRLRLRSINSPVSVAFPGGQSQFALIVMNLDQRVPMNLTGLSSSLHGSLSGVGGCSFPQTVAPNGIYRCTPFLDISGPVGARISTTFTASADHAGAAATSTASASTTIVAPPAGTDVLYVVGNAATLAGQEITLRNRLDVNYNVVVADDNTVVAADAEAKAFVLVSSSINNTTLGTKLRDVAAPVIVHKANYYDDMGLVAVGALGTVSQATVSVTDVLHPLAAARSGTQTIVNAARNIGWGVAGVDADVVAEATPGQAALFAYRAGAALPNGTTAAGCRIAFPLDLSGFSRINSSGWALFDRAVQYAASECGRNIIHTVAGTGANTTYLGDGNPSTAVSLRNPSGVEIDPDGGLVIVDTGNHSIRRVDLDTGIITTIAGTGTAGNTGDGGSATAARLSSPLRAEYDAAGNLYIADTANHRIRRIAAGTGVITTVAGTGTSGSSGDNGPATSARLNNPSDVAFDAAGNLYIADRGNHRVRKVTIETGVITTVAGNGSSGFTGDEVAATTTRLNSPYSVDVGPGGELYIADYNNERVRMVDTGGIVHTVAGTGVAAAGGDGGLAIDGDLHKPMHVMVDPSGGLWISEFNNTKVRYVSPDGTINSIAGTTVLGFAGDGGPPLLAVLNRPLATVMDAAGNVYVADRDNRRVRRILPS